LNYGTYTTFDCPTKKQDDAYAWLQAEFGKIDGTVRKLLNPHDFGSYPSFEVDYPHEEWTLIDESDTDEESVEMMKKKDEWLGKADIIHSRYNKRFEKYL